MRLRRLLLAPAALALLGQDAAAPETPAPSAPAPAPAPAPRAADAPRPAPRKVTPMAERVATLVVLNKENGQTQALKMRPGQAVDRESTPLNSSHEWASRGLYSDGNTKTNVR